MKCHSISRWASAAILRDASCSEGALAGVKGFLDMACRPGLAHGQQPHASGSTAGGGGGALDALQHSLQVGRD
jgi:hypothetical protein